MVKKILVSQPKPTSNKSLYYTISEDFGVEIVFRPFIKVESVTMQEFRQQHINFHDYTAIIFTSRHAIDNYFALAKEARFNVPETMKYFCVTETIALYIQKYTQYRKRKIFFGASGKIDDLIPSMLKHKNEKYLVPTSDVASNCITELLDKNGLNHTECIMYRTVNNTFSKEELKAFDYDMALFFSPTGIKALKETFPDLKDGDLRIGTFGPATAQAARDAGFSLAIEAPTEKYPSMTSALRHYLQDNED
jgi:uroporphyrinogen-III synthase